VESNVWAGVTASAFFCGQKFKSVTIAGQNEHKQKKEKGL
jgi:hypothetical protein